jgi:lipopolysaccharide/colanic/teichoic acid biosynthesis glycosyltransferase
MGSLVLGFILTPVILVLAAGSAISFKAWPFFLQPRLGLNGRVFPCIKLRSLPRTTPTTADKYTLAEHTTTRWGRFLRSTHLDELPQLYNVFVGQMSLVGPRPEMPSLSATFDQQFVAQRLTVRPGCTGLWQVSTAASGLIGERPEWDLAYLRGRTLRLHVWIMLRTAHLLFGGRPIECLDQVPRWTGVHRQLKSDRVLTALAPAASAGS